MKFLAEVAAISMVAVWVIVFAIQYICREIGYWLGRRYAAAATEGREGVGVLVGAILGLMSFVIAISLGATTNRFDQRRAVVLTEANAIGTAWFRTAPIDHPRSAEIGRLLERYAQVRADFVVANADQTRLDQLEQQTSRLQQEIWNEFTFLMREITTPATANLQVSLNEVFDAAAETRFALFAPYASRLFWLLVSMSLITMLALGYQLGLQGRPLRMIAVFLTILWSVVIVDILDMASARVGSIRMSAAPFEWTIRSFGPQPGH